MSKNRTYAGGLLVEEWDHDTRTYARWDMDGTQVEQRAYTEAENAEADALFEESSRLTDLEARVAALEAIVMAAPVPDDPVDPDVPTWDQLVPPNWWYAGTLVKDVDGTIYRNVSGSVLTEPPSRFPGGGAAWLGRLFVVASGADPDPEPDPDRPAGYVGPWSAETAYKVGDVVDRDGRYYRCLVAHGAEYEGAWGPPQASVWDDLGPA